MAELNVHPLLTECQSHLGLDVWFTKQETPIAMKKHQQALTAPPDRNEQSTINSIVRIAAHHGPSVKAIPVVA